MSVWQNIAQNIAQNSLILLNSYIYIMNLSHTQGSSLQKPQKNQETNKQ